MAKKAKQMTKEERVHGMISEIERAAIKYGLNITIYEDKIGFVDQKECKIIALWGADYKMSDLKREENE